MEARWMKGDMLKEQEQEKEEKRERKSRHEGKRAKAREGAKRLEERMKEQDLASRFRSKGSLSEEDRLVGLLAVLT